MSSDQQIDIRRTVEEISNVRAFPGLENAWHWTALGDRVNFVLVLTSDGRHALQVNTRDHFDAGVVRSVLTFCLAHEALALKANPLTILKGFSAQGTKFDIAVSAAPEVHQFHKTERPALHEVTYRVFPAYRCEFSGRETPKEAVLRMAKMVDPANLTRKPEPVVRLRYLNPRTKGRTLGENRGLADPMVLFGEVERLENTPGGFVEFENYLGQVRKVTWNGGFLFWNGDRAESLKKEDLLERIHKFILEGEAN